MVRKERLELSHLAILEPKSSASTNSATSAKDGVTDGTRTHDNRNHNPGLYQLSYNHRNKTCQRNMAHPVGFEPTTDALEGRCSIQLSYGRITYGHILKDLKWSVLQDLNLRPLRPKRSALPSCAKHRLIFKAFENLLPRDRAAYYGQPGIQSNTFLKIFSV